MLLESSVSLSADREKPMVWLMEARIPLAPLVARSNDMVSEACRMNDDAPSEPRENSMPWLIAPMNSFETPEEKERLIACEIPLLISCIPEASVDSDMV